MKARTLLLLVVVIGLAALFWSRGSEHEEQALSQESHEVAEQREGGELRDELASVKSEERGETRESLDDAESASESETWQVTARAQLSGKLPADEHLFVNAVNPDSDWNARVEAAADGSFQLKVPCSERNIELELHGRYVRSAEPAQVGRPSEDAPQRVSLPVELGSCLRVHLTPPASSQAEDFEGAKLRLRTTEYIVQTDRAEFLGDGLFEFRALAPDQLLQLLIECPGFVGTLHTGVRTFAGESEELEFTLLRGATMSGTVRLAGGTPAVGAKLTATRANPRKMSTVPWIDDRKATADASGGFSFDALDPGTWRVSVAAEGMLPLREVIGELTDEERREGLSLELVEGVRVSGRVAWPDGKSAADAELRAFRSAEPWRRNGEARADASGQFELSGLSGDSFIIVALADPEDEDAPRWSARRDDVPAGARDLELVLEAGGHISGNVTDDRGEPIDKFTLRARPLEVSGVVSTREPLKQRFKKAGGEFQVDGLGDGAWDVRVEARDHADSPWQRLRLPEDPGSLTFLLHREASISGVVVDPLGQPIVKAEVLVSAAGAKSHRGKTDEEGAFEVSGLVPGEVEVVASVEGFASNESIEISLAPGEQREGLRLMLGIGARVEGRVDASVEDFARRKVLMMPDDSYATISALCDEDGNFVFEGLAPGRWTVMFDWKGEKDWVPAYAKRGEREVFLTEGETTHVVLGLPLPDEVKLTGVVRLAGEPCANFLMYAQPPTNDTAKPAAMPLMIVRTDEEGRYEMTLPEPGPYRFSVGPDTRYQVRYFYTVPAGSEATHDVEYPAQSLSGKVMLPSGEPVARQSLMLMHADAPAGSRAFGDLHTTATDAEGRFELDAVQPGEYLLRTGGWGVPSEELGVRVFGDIVVTAGEDKTDLEFVLAPAAVIEGVVVGRAGAPEQGVSLRLVNEAGHDLYIWNEVLTDHAGAFRFPSVGPGRVRLLATAEDGATTEHSVHLSTGETRSITVQLDG